MDRSTREPRNRARDERYGLAELAETAGVSVRTVRYYIAEGLLPPPEGGGARSAYTRGHLDRLRLIGHLKAAYLPLREIRGRLAGLDDAAVRDLLEGHTEHPVPQAEKGQAALDSAAAYLARVLAPRAAPPASPPRPRLSMNAMAQPLVPVEDSASSPEQEDERRATAEAVRVDLDRGAALAEAPPPPLDSPPEIWRRVALGPDVELLIRDDAFERRRDKIAWLIDWAKKVLE